MTKLLYVHAIVAREAGAVSDLGRGIGGGELELVGLRRTTAAVVERVSQVPPATAKSVVAHDRIVRRLARHFPAVLPLRFGTTSPDTASLRALLVPLAEAIAAALARVDRAVQFDLRLRGQPAAPAALPKNAGPGTRWLAKRTARERVPELSPVTEATASLIRAARLARHDVQRRPGPGEPFASAYHLVERTKVRAWRRAVLSAIPLLPRDVEVAITGPFPPYAFAELG